MRTIFSKVGDKKVSIQSFYRMIWKSLTKALELYNWTEKDSYIWLINLGRSCSWACGLEQKAASVEQSKVA